MDKENVRAYVSELIHSFYRSTSSILDEKINQSTNFADLDLTKYEIMKLIMACEERFIFSVGNDIPRSIEELVNMAVERSAYNNIQPITSPEDFERIVAEENKELEDEKLEAPPAEIKIDEDVKIEKTENSTEETEEEVTEGE